MEHPSVASTPLAGGIAPAMNTGPSAMVWSLSALLVLVLVEVAARLIEPTIDSPPVTWYDAAAQQRAETLTTIEPDVVFAGTSMAWQAFVPEVFDDSSAFDQSFNVGLNGAVPTVTSQWLTGTVAERANPDVVVWGLSSLDFSTSYGEAPLDAWDAAIATRQDTLGRVDTAGRSVSATLRLRRLVRDPASLWGTGGAQRAQEWEDAINVTGAGGERLDFTVDKSDRNAAITRARLNDFAIDIDDVSAIESTVASLSSSGARVVLVELPVPPSFIDLHPNAEADHDRVGDTISLLAEGLGVEYIDMSTGYAEDDFVDFTHLSAAAAERFSREFAQALPRETTAASTPETTPQSAPQSAPPSESADTGSLAQGVVDQVNPETPAALADADAQVDDDGCETEIVVDEYGFEIEISTCDDTAAPEAVVLDEAVILAAIPEPELRTQAEALLDLAERAGQACSDQSDWTTATNTAASAAFSFAAVVDASASPWIESDDANNFAELLRNRLVLQTDCVDGFSGDVTQAALDAAAAAGRANDTVRLAAAQTPTLAAASQFWWRNDETGHVIQIADLIDRGDNPDVLIFGSSVTKRGFDPNTIGNAVGTTAYNSGIAGLFSDASGDWWGHLTDIGVAPRTIVVGRAAFEEFRPCDNRRTGRSLNARTFRENAFREIPAFASIPDVELLAGSLDAELGPVLDQFVSVHDGLGNVDNPAVTDQAALTSGLNAFAPEYDPPVICEEQQAAFAQFVESMVAFEGVEEVIVVDMPLHPDVIALHPEGRAGFDATSAIAQATATDLGATYLDARYLLTADQFADHVHASSVGRDIVTEFVIDALVGNG